MQPVSLREGTTKLRGTRRVRRRGTRRRGARRSERARGDWLRAARTASRPTRPSHRSRQPHAPRRSTVLGREQQVRFRRVRLRFRRVHPRAKHGESGGEAMRRRVLGYPGRLDPIHARGACLRCDAPTARATCARGIATSRLLRPPRPGAPMRPSPATDQEAPRSPRATTGAARSCKSQVASRERGWRHLARIGVDTPTPPGGVRGGRSSNRPGEVFGILCPWVVCQRQRTPKPGEASEEG